MKKLFAMMMAVLMVVSMFAACGGAGNAETTAPAGDAETSAPAGDAETTTEGSTAAAPIKIGTSGPLTGDYAVYGVAVANGLEMAFQEINALGDLQFEVKAEDDEADSEKAVNAYNSLMDWGMQIMAGPVTSGSAAATAAECVADGVFMLTPSASDAAVIAAGDNVFQICFTDPNQGKASAQYIFNHKMGTKVGVIYDSSSPYSAGIYATFKEEAAVLGLEIAVEAPFTESTKGDLTTQVTNCQQAGCDMVFLPIYTAEAAKVLSVANSNGYTTKFFGCDGLDGILNVEDFDASLAEGVMLLTPFDATATDEKTQTFVKNYTEQYGIAPNQFAADAYDVAYAIYQACKAGNVTSDMTAAEINEIMVAQITTMSFDGLTGLGMTWAADGAVSKEPMAVVIENGAYVGVDK